MLASFMLGTPTGEFYYRVVVHNHGTIYIVRIQIDDIMGEEHREKRVEYSSTNSSKSFGDCPEVLNEFEPVISPSQPVHL
jgi:hypothetical protein